MYSKTISRHKLTVEKLATALHLAAWDAAMQQPADDLGAAIRQEDGIRRALVVLTATGFLRNVSALPA